MTKNIYGRGLYLLKYERAPRNVFSANHIDTIIKQLFSFNKVKLPDKNKFCGSKKLIKKQNNFEIKGKLFDKIFKIATKNLVKKNRFSTENGW